MLERRIKACEQALDRSQLRGGRIGIEKESLRVSPEGTLARTPHPEVFGSALTHPHLTTDYSEAMLEFITDPQAEPAAVLEQLRALHRFVHARLEEEMLWATSMPCVLHGDDSIPIARYGNSNLGMMKTVYRRGLGHRYGRPMQVISGVHFNFSFDPELWPALQALEGSDEPPVAFRSRRYMDLTRNLQRYGWLVPYLFGASPAVCKSFVGPVSHRLKVFNENTFYDPWATSLRLGDIGYTNKREHEVGIRADYNSLEGYIETLSCAISTPSPVWERIGVVVNGRWEQLNANILQIENEYYTTVRPKQPLQGLEKPVLALCRRGVDYVELRSLDVNAFDPLGINGTQLRFLQSFMWYCLLRDSPPIDEAAHAEHDHNLIETAHHGRAPDFRLLRDGREVPLRQWAAELLDEMQGVCELLDGGDEGPWCRALAEQRALVEEPDATPSARQLERMRQEGYGFFHFAQDMSQRHHEHFCRLPVDAEAEARLEAEARRSHEEQARIEAEPQAPFDEFLAEYFAQN